MTKLTITVKQGLEVKAEIVTRAGLRIDDMEKILEIETWLNEHTDHRFHFNVTK